MGIGIEIFFIEPHFLVLVRSGFISSVVLNPTLELHKNSKSL